MNEVITTILGIGVAMSPIVMILVESVKATGVVNKRVLPIVSIIIGVASGVGMSVISPETGSLGLLAVAGVVAGGMASGIYSAVNHKPTVEIEADEDIDMTRRF